MQHNHDLKSETNRKKIKELVEKKAREIRGYTPRVGVFGVTGVGKSSLCNALFGKDLAKVSDVAACTREAQEMTISSNENGSGGIVLIDVPGVGETIDRDKEYFELYKELSPTLDLVIWVIKADDRAYAVAEKAYKEILEPNKEKCPVLFVVNQVDNVAPIFDYATGIPFWDMQENKPLAEQEANINKKVTEISHAFDISTRYIQTASVTRKFNIVETMEKIIEILPNEKKYSLFREAKEDIKNEKMEIEAETGVWESVKEWVGDAWESVKEVVAEVAVEVAKSVGKKILGWFSKKF
ncbi:YfjP family GTPase [Mixta sp. Marseille-Q2659]|uniref:GTPase family protein n=1 Tax=Mixta sp. Marseille-Q2659 TaxID=2736607 RepID=UPI0023B96D75|nr:YfjP family GTPase [Mixta sp. Marseille-Q2659]